jgi:DNA-binding beta-propeller fold protein YncE
LKPNSTASIPVTGNPLAVAVNSITNKIYALASGPNDTGVLNVIDGVTLSNTTVPTGNGPAAVVVNPATNKSEKFGPRGVK